MAMAAAAASSRPRSIALTVRPAPSQGRRDGSEWWIEPVRRIALAIFLAIPLLGWLRQPLAGRIVWTVAVASLPMFIVWIGFHRWRRICPLALLATLPQRLGWQSKRKASPWLAANYYRVALSIFAVSLWLRLVATNGDARAISIFFALLALAALTIGVLYTGKTWCNYFCPVSFIEKLYTEPHAASTAAHAAHAATSQCARCTGCKKFCPDIDQENGYRKELALPSKRFAWFAFPGLVFGFYFYYLLQSGGWSYYFAGVWTDEPRLLSGAFQPGHDAATAGFYFLPEMPRALAAALTLLACAAASSAMFRALERTVTRHLSAQPPSQPRHIVFSIAAFAAFVTFYTFAGAPTLRLVPHLHEAFFAVVLLTASINLLRAVRRRAPLASLAPGLCHAVACFFAPRSLSLWFPSSFSSCSAARPNTPLTSP
jgi:hypothetical protein